MPRAYARVDEQHLPALVERISQRPIENPDRLRARAGGLAEKYTQRVQCIRVFRVETYRTPIVTFGLGRVAHTVVEQRDRAVGGRKIGILLERLLELLHRQIKLILSQILGAESDVVLGGLFLLGRRRHAADLGRHTRARHERQADQCQSPVH